MLNFIGIGSAFNPTLGNTCAYIRNNDALLLIDCGGTVFSSLMQKELLKDLGKLSIVITHTHSDHIGSIGDIIFYANYILGIKPLIIFPEKKIINNLLNLMGVNNSLYELCDDLEINLDNQVLKKCRIKFLSIPHVSDIPSYAFIMNYDSKKYYYSGDANMISDEILAMFKNNIINYIYQDTCGLDYDNNVHLGLKKLSLIIPEKMRNRVYCIHYDRHIKREEVEYLGFNYITSS